MSMTTGKKVVFLVCALTISACGGLTSFAVAGPLSGPTGPKALAILLLWGLVTLPLQNFKQFDRWFITGEADSVTPIKEEPQGARLKRQLRAFDQLGLRRSMLTIILLWAGFLDVYLLQKQACVTAGGEYHGGLCFKPGSVLP